MVRSGTVFVMNILIAFDSLKDAISAAEAGRIAEKVVSQRLPQASVHLAPITDGGEGFADILSNALGGELRHHSVAGPHFAPVEGRFGLVPLEAVPPTALSRLDLPVSAHGRPMAIVEMASASGLESIPREARDPWTASSLGTGQLLQEAVHAGAGSIVLGIGGSATNDAGAGALEALGVCYYDRDLQPVRRVTPSTFKDINSAGSTSHLINAFPALRIACDVSNPLTGPHGATRIFGPQKGLKEVDADRMERTIQKMGCRLLGLFGHPPSEWERLLAEPGAGAAGGAGFALRHALPDSRFVEGAPLVADLLDLPAKAAAADLLITGEGRLDQSSLHGKGPLAVARLLPATKRCLILVGSAEATVVDQLAKAHPNILVVPISDPEWPLETALARTGDAIATALDKVL
jgi:glycerate kinase